jgi:hypothetical protein
MTFHRSGAATSRRRSSALDLARGFALVTAVVLVQGGCKADGYELGIGGGNSRNDSGPGGGGGDGGGGGMFDAGPDATTMPDACPVAQETCDGEDNDCDGNIDEDFLPFESNPAHCGGCAGMTGQACVLPHMAGTCALNVCSFKCLPGFHDLDPEVPGCEYQCIPTNGGVEICDFADNNCNGETDEGTNTDTDVANCGGCGRICTVLNAVPVCTDGDCGFDDCNEGYADILEQVPGCEYQCPNNPPAEFESCDGFDNDCDGIIDENIPTLGQPCSDFPEAGTGACTMGQVACSFGTEVCVNDVGPTSEICDEIDNDCSGTADEDFDTSNDVNHCGECDNRCVIPNAVATCSSSTCQILSCLSGWVDSDGDGDPVEGCDFQCTPSGPEVCDGIDNDCDRSTDEGVTPPSNFCKQAGGCAGTTPQCTGGPCAGPVQWRCVYEGADVETDGCGNLVLQEARCDGLDNDCDSRSDEAYLALGTACSDGQLGECQGTGEFVCNGAENGLTCNITDPGATTQPEACNDKDDDCDGDVDEDATDTMVQIDDGAGGLATFLIDAYEASRPDATMESGGSATHRACSNPLVRPWRLISRVEAELACGAAGKRLCTEVEWQLACEALDGNTYPYGDTYNDDTCNGRDYDTDPDASGNQDDPVATSELAMCFADWGGAGNRVFDLSGNVKEWTGSQVSGTAYRVRGGAYDNIKQALTCQFDFTAFDEDVELPNLGFRCCETVVP